MREKAIVVFSLCAALLLIVVVVTMHQGKVVVAEVPEELHSFVVIDSERNGAAAHMFTARSLNRIFGGNNGAIRDVATNGAVAAAVVAYAPTDSAVVWWGGAGPVTTIERGEEEKHTVAISSDGGYVVYTRGLADAVPEIVLTEVSSRDTQVLGRGHDPHLVSYHPNGDAESRLAVVYDTSEGLVAVDVMNDIDTLLPEFSAVFKEGALYTSPSGKYMVVLNAETNEYVVFEVYRLFPLGLNPIGIIPNGYVSVALSDDALYGITEQEDGRHIVRLSFATLSAEPSRVFTFPDTVKPSRLIAPIR